MISDIKTPQSLLDAMVESVRNYKMTPAERFEQRVSFVWGMMSSRSTLTKSDVRRMLAEGCGAP